MAPASPEINTNLKIHKITKITPPTTSSASPFSVPLTFFDTLWFKFLPVERLFFYQLTESSSSSHYFNSVILPNLKRSLSLTLLHYLPLAGTLMWPPGSSKPAIYYSPSDGVSLTVAEYMAEADFHTLTGDEIHRAVDFNPMVPELFTSDDKAEVMSVQITYFPNQGFCIGISTHHACVDGKSSTMFIKSWAYFCKQLNNKENLNSLPEELTPFFDRTLIKDPIGLDMIYVKHWLEMTQSSFDPNKRSLKIMSHVESDVCNLVRATFELKREDINKLREKVCEILGLEESKCLHLSPFILTLAYVFVWIVKAKGGESERKVQFGFPANYRRRLDPPIPLNYFGNCVWGSNMFVASAGDFMEQNGVVFVTEKLSDMRKGLENKNLFDGAEEMFTRNMKTFGNIETLGVAGSPNFQVYSSDFGWGRPKKVEIVSINRTGAISLAESRDESGGVEAGIVLGKKEMETFASLLADELGRNMN